MTLHANQTISNPNLTVIKRIQLKAFFLGIAFMIAAMGVAISAIILQKLLENAIEMKSEIELTV
ncbi:DUF2975 domain-containing protein [Solibacillus cecembensis]|uniref:DUF2975 domain-containing protein n=1 Tax=Solibacillus cecembensis TaxID=459347 RepID=UPI003D00B4CE